MKRLMPTEKKLRQICQAIGQYDVPTYLVGGYIRDWLLGRESHDLDFAIDGNAANMARQIANRFGGHFLLLDAEHDTARALFKQGDQIYYADLAGLRGEGIMADLLARDFTINAMAVATYELGQPEPSIIDPTNGQRDLERRRIRATSAHAFQDDPIRLLRAVRQAAILGFRIESKTEGWLKRDAPLLTDMAGERILAELDALLSCQGAAKHFEYLADLGLLETFLPLATQLPPQAWTRTCATVRTVETMLDARQGPAALSPLRPWLDRHLDQIVADTRQRRMLLKLAALLHQTPVATDADNARLKAALQRLRLSGHELYLVNTIIHHWREPLSWPNALSDRQLYRFFYRYEDAGVEIVLLALAHVLCDHLDGPSATARATAVSQSEQAITYYAQRWPTITALPRLVDGRDLMSTLNLAGGPRIGILLERIREQQVLGHLDSPHQALNWAKSELEKLDAS